MWKRGNVKAEPALALSQFLKRRAIYILCAGPLFRDSVYGEIISMLSQLPADPLCEANSLLAVQAEQGLGLQREPLTGSGLGIAGNFFCLQFLEGDGDCATLRLRGGKAESRKQASPLGLG